MHLWVSTQHCYFIVRGQRQQLNLDNASSSRCCKFFACFAFSDNIDSFDKFGLTKFAVSLLSNKIKNCKLFSRQKCSKSHTQQKGYWSQSSRFNAKIETKFTNINSIFETIIPDDLWTTLELWYIDIINLNLRINTVRHAQS